jgi:hypothetical protein
MNFLALCQRLRSEAGVAGSGPAAVTGQTGELLRLVNWVKDAYRDIQDRRDDWEFLRLDFTFSASVVGGATYAKTSVSNLANWKHDQRDSFRCYLTATGENDEQWLTFEDWDKFRATRLFGANRSNTGRPLYFSIKPNKSIVLWPAPDATYTIAGEYFRTAAEFSADADEPLFDRHHMAIVYNALMRYAAYVGEPSLYARAESEHKKLIRKLERDYVHNLMLGSALA